MGKYSFFKIDTFSSQVKKREAMRHVINGNRVKITKEIHPLMDALPKRLHRLGLIGEEFKQILELPVHTNYRKATILLDFLGRSMVKTVHRIYAVMYETARLFDIDTSLETFKKVLDVEREVS
jgi:hypothetical protein